jgi:LPXTG-motif cell wall-anchored protein
MVRHHFATIYRGAALFAPQPCSFSGLKYAYRAVSRETEKRRAMKLVHAAAQARRLVAFNDLAGDFLKMLGVAALSGLFFSLVVGLVVFLVASDAYAQPIADLAQADLNVAPLHVSGIDGNEPWSKALTSPETRERSDVGALWARHKIASLMDQAPAVANPGKVQARVNEAARGHLLISNYTSRLAVDVTPVRPQYASLKSGAVQTNTPADSVQQRKLPRTATAATQNLIAGGLAMLLGAAVLLVMRRCVGGMP